MEIVMIVERKLHLDTDCLRV